VLFSQCEAPVVHQPGMSKLHGQLATLFGIGGRSGSDRLCGGASSALFGSAISSCATSKRTLPTVDTNLRRVHRHGKRLFSQGYSLRNTLAGYPLILPTP
jgi:hypothetical protein